jgi:hypothetical protein
MTPASAADPSSPDLLEPYWSETALDWFQRAQKLQTKKSEPRDPASAAQCFLTDPSTGLAFVDQALSFAQAKQSTLVEVTGPANLTSWTLISLAARFVLATRSSKFVSSNTTLSKLPRVILFDPLYNISIHRLVVTVRSLLLLEDKVEELEACLQLIQIVWVQDTTSAVAALEVLRQSETLPLVLWQDFLTTTQSEAGRVEISRQLLRLEDCPLVVVSSNRPQSCVQKHIDSRIKLSDDGGEYSASVQTKGSQTSSSFGFTIGSAGILSS